MALRRALLVLALCAVAARAVHFEFSKGSLDGWVHSEDSKYSGKFKVEKPEGLPNAALQVSRRQRGA